MITPDFLPGAPGAFSGLPHSLYLLAPGTSNSMLGHLRPPARLPAYLDEERDPTEAMQLGTLIHSRIIEPDQPLPRLAVPPESYENEKGELKPWTYAAKKCKAWRMEREAEGKLVITSAFLEKLTCCVDAIRADHWCAHAFSVGRGELSLFEALPDLSGHPVLVKGRVDWVPAVGNCLVDVKKVSAGNADPEAFRRLMFDRRYHVQAALYLMLWRAIHGDADPRPNFVFVAVEDVPPYLVAKHLVGPKSIEAGWRTAQEDLHTLRVCEIAGSWPGYADAPQLLEVPSYKLKHDDFI